MHVAQPRLLLKSILTELRAATTATSAFCTVADKAARIVLAQALDLVDCQWGGEGGSVALRSDGLIRGPDRGPI